jgi:cation transport ATPase
VVEDVQADRGRYARLVDGFARFWTPGILLVASAIVVLGGGITGITYII